MKKYCILYSYFETNYSKKNLYFFIKKGVVFNNDVFFVFLINNHKCSVKIPIQNNIKIIRRNNIGHDFGSWKHGLKSINMNIFDYFIFMNDAVLGPFLPRYIPKNIKWYYMFCNLISNKVKLSGLTINYYPWNIPNKNFKHVQSMMFCTDKIGLNVSIKNSKKNKGTITFSYHDIEQLNKIIEIIKSNY